jgi:transcriptional regulator with XRE-family HTH domain
LGYLLRALREERKLSLRELAQLADVDHAYVHRLETGEREAPSEEMLGKLARGLKPQKREAEMLQYLAQFVQTAPGLVRFTLEDPSVSFQEFTTLAGAAFRGGVDYASTLKIIRRVQKEAEGG